MLLYYFCFVLHCISGQFPLGAYIRGNDLMEGCLASLYLDGLIRGAAYFRNFSVL